jgi:hypothetical protein
MKVRDWQDVVEEVVSNDVDPEGWRAVAGARAGGVGEDLYLGHPAGGVFQIKTYAKNPFEVKGVGTQVARTVDADVRSALPGDDGGSGRFAVQSPPKDEDHAEEVAARVEEVVKAHAEAPTEADDLFDDVMEAMDSPAYGPMAYDGYDRPDELDTLAETFADAESALEAEFDDLVADDDIGKGFA